MDYLHLAAIVKDELYLEEWVRYHLLLGVEKIILFDNGSKAPVEDTLNNFVESGTVEVHHVLGRGRQVSVYHLACHLGRGKVRWMAFLDADEFLVPHSTDDLHTLLKSYESFSGVGFNWQMFGPNGHSKRPGLPQMLAYTTKVPLQTAVNQHIKSIVCPDDVVSWPNPHGAVYSPGRYCVNEMKVRIDGPFSPPSTTHAQINHYHTRSLQDWRDKLARGTPDKEDPCATAKKETFDILLRDAVIPDYSIQRFARRLYPTL